MAEKSEKKPEAAPAAAEKPAAKAGLMGKTPVLLGAVMVLEAAVLFAGFKVLGGGPASAAGAELTTSEGDEGHGDGHGGKSGKASDKKKPVEHCYDCVGYLARARLDYQPDLPDSS